MGKRCRRYGFYGIIAELHYTVSKEVRLGFLRWCEGRFSICKKGSKEKGGGGSHFVWNCEFTGLTSLEKRRLSGNLIETFIILH